jgi:hypothetical protein
MIFVLAVMAYWMEHFKIWRKKSSSPKPRSARVREEAIGPGGALAVP